MQKYEDLAPHHKMMVDDGFPIDLILSPEERKEAWAKASAILPSGSVVPTVPNIGRLTPQSRERVLKLIRECKFRPEWLEDPSYVEYVEQRTIELSKVADLKRAEAEQRWANLPKKEKKPTVAPFGTGIKITVLKEVSFRKEGSKGAAIYAEMVAWMKKNPTSDLTTLIANTGYHKGFYLADLERENIKSDVK